MRAGRSRPGSRFLGWLSDQPVVCVAVVVAAVIGYIVTVATL